MKKISIKKVGVHSVAKVIGALYVLIGLVPGLFLTLLSLLPISVEGGESMSFFFGIGAMVVLPIFYGAIGYIFGALFAWLYNQIAPRIGGLQLDVEEVVNTDTQE